MLPPLEQIPPEVAALADYEKFAQQRVAAGIWTYLNGGAGDEWTMAENVAAFARYPLRSRVLRSMKGASTRIGLLGCDLAAPILMAPTAFQKLAHPDGEIASVLAAGATDTCMVVSTQASVLLEEIAATAQGPLWFQLYVQPDRAFTEQLVIRAEAAGYRALVVTVDSPVTGVRNAEARAGFVLPPHVRAVNLEGMRAPPSANSGALLFGTPLLESAAEWADLDWLRKITRLPIVLKGIVDPEDARRALEAGADGVVVSNHGGRALDGVPATIDLLPAVSDVVAGRVPVLMDGGIRRGIDVLRALALGADAVMVGRPFVHALATAGALGVAHAIRVLRAELELAMALTGCSNVPEVTRSVVAGSVQSQR